MKTKLRPISEKPNVTVPAIAKNSSYKPIENAVNSEDLQNSLYLQGRGDLNAKCETGSEERQQKTANTTRP